MITNQINIKSLKPLFISFLLLLVLSCPCSITSSPIVLEPLTETGEEIGIIFVQGCEIEGDKYLPLAKKIQETLTGFKTWVSITDAFLEIPISIIATKAIDDCKDALFSRGLSNSNKLFIMGHSLGGVAAVNYYESNRELAGAVLLGSFPERSQRGRTLTKDLNLLMIGGELDGLARVTRTAEEFYHRCLIKDDGDKLPNLHAELNFLNFLEEKDSNLFSPFSTASPVVVLKGLNHMSFASGEPSFFVRQRDLKAEVSEEQGHEQISQAIRNFLTKDNKALQEDLLSTYNFIKPLISAYELEGSLHFNRPEQSNCHRGFCGNGSEWGKTAQAIISDSELLSAKEVKLDISNEFVILSSLPPFGDLFHPALSFDPKEKVLSIKTYSQCAWDFMDKYFDGGFAPTSASEIGSKLSSRQCSYVVSAVHKKEETPLTVDTEGNLCALVNKAAFKWALENSDAATKERFNKFGQKINFLNDKMYGNGFSWTTSVLNWTENATTGEMDLLSYTMITDIDAKPIPIFAPDGLDCYHYCKLLSPARAMEWIYVDGLRKNYSISK